MFDAGVLIALADERDTHHGAAARFVEANSDEHFVANAVNLAESLVHAVEEAVLGDVFDAYELIGIMPLDVAGESAGAIARVRASTHLKMPDALAIHSCEREGAELVTTDETLARVAMGRGVRTHLLTQDPVG
jgi:predicted nucleic acid-binding protein